MIVALLYNLLILVVAAGIAGLKKRRFVERVLRVKDLLILGYLGLLVFVLALLLPGDPFATLQVLSWLLFLHLPIYLVVFGLCLEKGRPLARATLLVLAALLVAVGIDAFMVEPYALVVTHRRIYSDKVAEPIRIALLADIQTDDPGDYDRRVLARVKRASPDLILFAGDYIQAEGHVRSLKATQQLNRLLQKADLKPTLGKIAVQGNIDYGRPWQQVFANTHTTVVEKKITLDLGPVVVTGLTFEQSYNTRCRVTPQEKYHIVLGHCPNFALGDIGADLLLAGHTHGGQVRLPFVGPLLTFSSVPRSWAAGLTEIAPGKNLIVSRGIGLERGHAPRLRFLCRPELVIIDLVPPNKGDADPRNH